CSLKGGLAAPLRYPTPFIALYRPYRSNSFLLACHLGAGLFAELSVGEGFALLGELLLSVATKVAKNACPSIRPGALRRVPSLHRCSEGPALTGRPWPDNAFRRIPAAHPSTQRLRSAGLKGAVSAPEPRSM